MRLFEVAKTLNPPSISVGDEVKVGKWKNRKAEVKGFKTDDNGQPVLKTTKGDQKLYKPRVSKLEPKKVEEEEEGYDPYDFSEKETDDSTCDWCGGEMQWCSVCTQWTKTCCQDYGTCMCS